MKNWEIKKLGEVCKFVGGSQPPKSNFSYEEKEGYIRLIQIRDYKSDKNIVYIPKDKAKRFCDENDIMIGRYGPPVFQILKGLNGAYNVALMKAVPNEKILSKDYAFLFLKFSKIQDYIIHLSQRAAGQTGVNKEAIEDYPIVVPPLPEQQRIVAVLNEVFESIAKAKANAEQNLKNVKALFESYLQNVFETKGIGWEEKTLGEIATFRNGMNFTKSSKGEKINIVGVKDFQNSFWVPFATLDMVTLDGTLNDLDLLKEGDILAVRSNGNPQLIGRTLLASEVVGKVSHSGFTIRIRLNANNVDPVYLCNFLKIGKTRKILVDGGNGVGIKSLNQGSLAALVVPIPSLKQQQTIVQKIDALSTETKKLETIYKKKINDLEELKKSVLQKGFAGELNNNAEVNKQLSEVNV